MLLSRKTISASYRSFLGDQTVDRFLGSGAADRYVEENVDRCLGKRSTMTSARRTTRSISSSPSTSGAQRPLRSRPHREAGAEPAGILSGLVDARDAPVEPHRDEAVPPRRGRRPGRTRPVTDPPHPLRLLGLRGEWPRRAAEKRDELAPFHVNP